LFNKKCHEIAVKIVEMLLPIASDFAKVLPKDYAFAAIGCDICDASTFERRG
jgi:hypothetical protein